MRKTLMITTALMSLLLSAQVSAAGAIAIDGYEGDSIHEIGYGIGFAKDRDSAAKESMRKCRNSGNDNCVVKVRFDGCGAYAVSKRFYGVGTGRTLAQAERAALDQCGNKSCRVAVSECDN